MSLKALAGSSYRRTPQRCIFKGSPLHCHLVGPRQFPFYTIIIRGAKTRTKLNAKDLPQGVLPPLPQHEYDRKVLPDRSYPTVLQQHLDNIRKFKDCIILTRVGDFYELYFDQVEQYAPLVNLKKAVRRTVLGDVPMAGFQHTQLERYLKMFVQDLGKQVAISEQVRIPEEERTGAAQYDRKVTRVVTAGTLIDESFMDPFENNYLLGVSFDGVILPSDETKQDAKLLEAYRRSTKVGLAWVDLSSGDFFTQACDLASLSSVVVRIAPREVVLDSSMHRSNQIELQKLLGEGPFSLNFHRLTNIDVDPESWARLLETPLNNEQITGFSDVEVLAGSTILDYSQKHLMDMNLRLRQPVRRSDDEFMSIDRQSLRGLEIRDTLRDGLFTGSLLHSVRRTVTKSGARLLSQRLVSPSMSMLIINNRLDLVEELLNSNALRETLVGLLRRTFDTLRLLQKFSLGKGDADDMLGLARTIQITRDIADLLREHVISAEDTRNTQSAPRTLPADLAFLWDIIDRFNLEGPLKLAQRVLDAIDEEGLSRRLFAEQQEQMEAAGMAEEVEDAEAAGEEAPHLARRATSTKKTRKVSTTDNVPEEIWIMRKVASTTLSKAHDDLDRLLQAKLDLAAKLRINMAADSLTLKWSAQLGHFCHIKGRDAKTAGNELLSGARSISSTKSTRSFYLADWTHLGSRIDDAKRRIRSEEERVFSILRNTVIENLVKLRRNAAVLDELDVACSSATVARERNLIRPTLTEKPCHNIIGGRHPMVDAGLQEQGRLFTANDCSVGSDQRVYLITGPNMGGKSTYLRQNALITILAQTGCFVPADYAEVGLVDKVFSRVGSADNLFQDQSTFMVEMLETAEILRQATPRSFVIMDEVGRGTTPEDGVAVGYACLYHLHQVNKCRTLFATHFHALAEMTEGLEKLGYYCTDVVEDSDGSWSFAHRLKEGVNRESHALKVARLAGMPDEAIAVAQKALETLQQPAEHRTVGISRGQQDLLATAG